MTKEVANKKTIEVITNNELAEIFNVIDYNINQGSFSCKITKSDYDPYCYEKLIELGYEVSDIDGDKKYISWR